MNTRFILLSLSLLVASRMAACTNFIVGKKASTDGSVMVTYNADDYGMFQGLCLYPAAHHAKGEMLKIYDWDTGEYHGEIPQVAYTYHVIGNINEHQLSIAETTYGGREEMVDTTGTIDYGSLIYIALQRARTAREAIGVMTSLVEKYGYCSEGETFSICDPNEAWIMEMMGTGAGSKGVVWVAQRIPDDAICAHANQSRIGKFDMRDKRNVMHSKNVIAYARKMGWFSGNDADFSWKHVYAAPDFGGRRFCDARVWSFFNRYADGFDRYLPWALGKDAHAEDMPLWIVPNRKLSVHDLETAMRDHYEGTPLALDTTSIGGGIYQMPYRPTPLTFKVDGKEYFNERPISTQQTAFTFVAQLRSWLPNEIGGVLWFGNDDANMIAYTPVYCASTRQPLCYSTPGADAVTFSADNAFWMCNFVSNMIYQRYSQLFPELQAVRDSLEQDYFASQQSVEQHALSLYASDKAAAIEHLTSYGCDQAQRMLSAWQQLALRIIVKYNDMAVKKEVDGKMLHNVTRPGYPESFARKLVKQTGDLYAVPKEKE